ncbi:MAG: hypothetical protein ACC645_14530 [Pirellulales bacterium]
MSRTMTNTSLLLAAATLIISASSAQAGDCRYQHDYRPYHRSTLIRQVVHHRPVAVRPGGGASSQPVAPAADLPSVPAGSTLSLPANFLGPIPGQVFLVLHDVKLPVRIDDWQDNGVTITLPPMAVKQPTPARIDVVMPHGSEGNKVKILLVPPARLVLHPTPPASPLPTGPSGPAPHGPHGPAGPPASGPAGPPVEGPGPEAQAAFPQFGAPIVQGADR